MQQVRDGYHELASKFSQWRMPVNVETIGERQMVLGREICWGATELLEDGHTLTPLVVMTPSLVRVLQALCDGVSFYELAEAEQGELRAMLAELGEGA